MNAAVIPFPSTATSIPYSRGVGATDKRPKQRTAPTFAALAADLLADTGPAVPVGLAEDEMRRWKASAQLPWIAAPMGGNGFRNGANAQPWPILVLDVDEVQAHNDKEPLLVLNALSAALRKTAPRFGWATASHSATAPHVRYVLHLSRPVNADEAKALARVLADDLAASLGMTIGAPGSGATIALDPTMQDVAHIAFGPLAGCKTISLSEDVAPLDVDAYLSRKSTTGAATATTATATAGDFTAARLHTPDAEAEVREALLRINARNPDAVHDRVQWLRVLASLKSYGWPDAVMEPIAREWSEQSSKFDAARWSIDWYSLKTHGGITPATLFYLAGQAEDDCPDPTTDDGLACRFVAYLDGKAAYARSQWLAFDGVRWNPSTNTVERWLKDFAEENLDRTADEHAAAIKTGDERAIKAAARNLRAATLLLNQQKQAAVLKAASVLLYREASEFDTQHDLLCVPNGVVDLKTGVLLPPDPAHRFTMVAGVEYKPDAKCPRFEQFIREVFPDTDVAAYMQRWCGYLLTGCTNEDCMNVWYGSGANGKSVLMDVLAQVMGDFAIVGDPSMLMARSPGAGAASPDVARLVGRRLAYLNESRAGDRLNDARVKQLVSTEKMTARALYRDPFDFYPTAKLVLRTNNKPIVDDNSEGMWRRLHLVPFEQSFDGARRDRDLADKLKTELPGILAWCVRGAIEWYAKGLAPPPTIVAATEAYRDDSDDFAEWAGACLEHGGFTSTATLLASYAHYAGLKSPPTPKQFKAMMVAKGYRPDRTSTAKGFNVSLRPMPSDCEFV